MFPLPRSPPQNFLPLHPIIFFFLTPILHFSSFLPFVASSLSTHITLLSFHQAEQASLSHVVDLLSLILLTAIWAVCPRDSLALLGQWVQEKLSQVRSRMLSVIRCMKRFSNAR